MGCVGTRLYELHVLMANTAGLVSDLVLYRY
jgi:hypothetical protein